MLPGKPTLAQLYFDLLSEEAKNKKFELLLENVVSFVIIFEHVNAGYKYSRLVAPRSPNDLEISDPDSTTGETMSFFVDVAKKHIDSQAKIDFELLPYLE